VHAEKEEKVAALHWWQQQASWGGRSKSLVAFGTAGFSEKASLKKKNGHDGQGAQVGGGTPVPMRRKERTRLEEVNSTVPAREFD